MAWPTSARYQTFVSNVTTIVAAFMNDIQDKIYGIIGGGKTVKMLHADGTGDQATSATAGEVLASADIETTGGSVIANKTITATNSAAAASAITATSGNILASSGDVRSAVGNVEATSGQLIADGTIAGDSGPALVKFGRLYPTNATALGTNGVTSGDFAFHASWGGAGPPALAAAVTGTDTAGTITITVGAGPGADPDFTLTFKDLTWTNIPIAQVGLEYVNAAGKTIRDYFITWDTTATTLKVYLNTNAVALTAGDVFRFSWHVIGR